jgi:stress-induced morphogen
MCNPKDFDSIAIIENIIKEAIPNSNVVVENGPNDTHHLKLLVVSDFFKGKMLLEQHRLVMESLKQKFSEDLHAIELKTMTQEKYSEVG